MNNTFNKSLINDIGYNEYEPSIKDIVQNESIESTNFKTFSVNTLRKFRVFCVIILIVVKVIENYKHIC